MERLKISKYIMGLACFHIIVLVFCWRSSTLNQEKHSNPSTISSFSTPKQQQSHQHVTQEGNLRDLKTLESLVQRRLIYLQNPKNCTAAKKVLCRTNQHGFGSALHQLTFCLIVAYATQRTLILESKHWKYAEDGWETMFLPISTTCTSTMNSTVRIARNLKNITHIEVLELQGMQGMSYRPNYLPLAIPEDLAKDLRRVHRNPSLWWIGQFVIYLTRPNRDLQNYLQDRQKILGNMRPIAGLQIRRTDKAREADYHNVEEYMKHVDEWFNLHTKNVTSSRYVYLATDDLSVLEEAREKYPTYKFINEESASVTAKRKRYTENSLQGILLDIHMLSKCNFVTCTMSSNVCRLVYEIMQARDGKASTRVVSLDTDYFFTQKFPGKPFEESFRRNGSVILQIKGMSLVQDKRSNPSRPIFTVDKEIMAVDMPLYSNIKEIK